MLNINIKSMFHCKILPDLTKYSFTLVNVAEEVSQLYDLSVKDNPMKNYNTQEEALTKIKDKYQTNYTFGGYLEDRSNLWNGFESSSRMIHLGIDINNLLPGMIVVTPCDMTVVHVMVDQSKFNGWGSRLIFKLKEPYLGADYLLFGHLANVDLPVVGSEIKKEQKFGQIGDGNDNGGWFIHLHVQLIKQIMFDKYQSNLELLDGYLLDGEIDKGIDYSSDPTLLVFTTNIIKVDHLKDIILKILNTKYSMDFSDEFGFRWFFNHFSYDIFNTVNSTYINDAIVELPHFVDHMIDILGLSKYSENEKNNTNELSKLLLETLQSLNLHIYHKIVKIDEDIWRAADILVEIQRYDYPRKRFKRRVLITEIFAHNINSNNSNDSNDEILIAEVYALPCDECLLIYHQKNGPLVDAVIKLFNAVDGSGDTNLTYNMEGEIDDI